MSIPVTNNRKKEFMHGKKPMHKFWINRNTGTLTNVEPKDVSRFVYRVMTVSDARISANMNELKFEFVTP